MFNIFDLLKFTSDFLVGISLFMIAYILSIYFKNRLIEDVGRRKEITIDLCIKDEKNYELYLKNKHYNILASDRLTDNAEVNKILSYFEKISIGINTNVYDEEIVRSYYENYFTSFYKMYKHHILEYRDNYNLPFLYIEYEKTVKKWDNSREENKNEW